MSAPAEVLELIGDRQASLSLYTPLEALLAEYGAKREEIERIAAYVAGCSDVMGYFLSGAQREKSVGNYTATTLFAAPPAIRALDADYWSRAMRLTDVLELMPAALRNEWCRQIRMHETPPFEAASVRDTLRTLVASRSTFFADRVDGLFANLSDHHATNAPDGFSKRLVIRDMRTYFATLSLERSLYVHDLRCVIAAFAGRGEPPSGSTLRVLDKIHSESRFGEWVVFDGGAFRLRLFKVGTCHIEIHPAMAYRLNMVLAWKNPAAIPKAFRKRRPSIDGEAPIQTGLLPFRLIAEALSGIVSGDGLAIFFTTPVGPELAALLRQNGGTSADAQSWKFASAITPLLNDLDRYGRAESEAFPENVAS